MKRTGTTTPWRSLPVGIALLPLLPLLSGCGSGNRTIPVPSSTPTPVTTPTPSSSATPSPTPTPVVSGSLKPPYANKVIFVSRSNANERAQLYVMNPDGSQVTAINPLAYTSNYELLYPGTHFMNAAGTKFLLTFDVGTGSGAESLFVNTDGTGEKDITALLDPEASTEGSAGLGHVSEVSMNAAGTQFVFPYTSFAPGSDFAPSLVTMNADGTARTTRYTAPNGQEIMSPIFAPDGQTIYFVQGATDFTGVSPYPFSGGIYRLTAGATTPTLVTTLTTRGSATVSPLAGVSINADGTKLTFPNNVSGLSDEVFTVNVDGTGLKQLTTTAALNTDPSFIADGTKIVFVSYRDGNAEIYNINPDGTSETRLTYQIEPDTQPATRAAAKHAAALRSQRASIVKTTSHITTSGKAVRR